MHSPAGSSLNVADDFLGFVCQTADIPIRLRHFHAIVSLATVVSQQNGVK